MTAAGFGGAGSVSPAVDRPKRAGAVMRTVPSAPIARSDGGTREERVSRCPLTFPTLWRLGEQRIGDAQHLVARTALSHCLAEAPRPIDLCGKDVVPLFELERRS